MTDESGKNWFDSAASTLEKNTVGVKLVIYGVAVAGCCIAARSVRPFAKFKKPRDVPQHFVDARMKLTGRVMGLRFPYKSDSSSILLLVDHRPIFFAGLRSSSPLPVSIEGVDLTSNGVCWLQTIIKDGEVDFELFERNETSVGAVVRYKGEDVAKRLLSLGFATVSSFNVSFQNDRRYSKYYEELLRLESKAEKNKVGLWWDGSSYISWGDWIVKRLIKALPSNTKTVALIR